MYELLQQQAYVNGNWVDADSGAVTTICNPATGEALGQVPDLGAAETERAIQAAHAALPAWRALTAQARARILRRWFNLILKHQEQIALLITLEQGKPLSEARDEVAYAAISLNGSLKKGSACMGM